MAKRSNLKKLLLTATSFAGGMALGMILAPRSGRKSREWINDQTTEFADWVDGQGKDVLNKSSKQISQIRTKVRKGVKNNFPNLYEATEEIKLDESDFLGV